MSSPSQRARVLLLSKRMTAMPPAQDVGDCLAGLDLPAVHLMVGAWYSARTPSAMTHLQSRTMVDVLYSPTPPSPMTHEQSRLMFGVLYSDAIFFSSDMSAVSTDGQGLLQRQELFSNKTAMTQMQSRLEQGVQKSAGLSMVQNCLACGQLQHGLCRKCSKLS